MNKTRLVLGGIAGAIAATGVCFVPSIGNFSNKTNTRGKAIPMSWWEGVDANTDFYSFGEAFAPFLVDVENTDDLFWEARAEKNKEVYFDKNSLVFAGWSDITSTKDRIEAIKTGCKDFQIYEVDYSDPEDIQKTMSLCGIYDSENKKPEFAKVDDLASGETWTAQQVCDLLVSDVAEKVCREIGVSYGIDAST